MTYKGLSEEQVQNQILCYLSARGIYHWRQNTGVAKFDNRVVSFSQKGISDILGILPGGRFLAIEVKREKGGRTTIEQQRFIDEINSRGGLAFVANSLEKVVAELKKVI